MGKVGLSPAGESGTQEIGYPVEPVVAPVTGDDGRSKNTSGIEGPTRYRATNKAKEPEGETDSNRGETSLAVTRGSL